MDIEIKKGTTFKVKSRQIYLFILNVKEDEVKYHQLDLTNGCTCLDLSMPIDDFKGYLKIYWEVSILPLGIKTH